MQDSDREYMRQARVHHHDPVAEKHASGNVYSAADIEMLEDEHLRFWKRRRRDNNRL